MIWIDKTTSIPYVTEGIRDIKENCLQDVIALSNAHGFPVASGTATFLYYFFPETGFDIFIDAADLSNGLTPDLTLAWGALKGGIRKAARNILVDVATTAERTAIKFGYKSRRCLDIALENEKVMRGLGYETKFLMHESTEAFHVLCIAGPKKGALADDVYYVLHDSGNYEKLIDYLEYVVVPLKQKWWVMSKEDLFDYLRITSQI